MRIEDIQNPLQNDWIAVHLSLHTVAFSSDWNQARDNKKSSTPKHAFRQQIGKSELGNNHGQTNVSPY
jgi:hypothetical protein